MTLRSAALISCVCACLALYVRSSVPAKLSSNVSSTAETTLTPKEHCRAAEQTFLTFPEWYLVFSPDEYATFIADKNPSEFPFLGHIGQFWQGYDSINAAMKDDYPFNADYHVMIWIIGISTTVEYAIKWVYENTIGRVTEATRMNGMTEEDKFAAQVAREYVQFLDKDAWFNFDFLDAARRLWTDIDVFGSDPIRKWERRYYLTNEYAAKALYGVLLKLASESSFGIEAATTYVLLDGEPNLPGVGLPAGAIKHVFPDGKVLVAGPRYQAFTPLAAAIADAGVNFVEICGNRGQILVSVVGQPAVEMPTEGLLFVQPISTQPGLRRFVYSVRVGELASLVRSLKNSKAKVEHVFDY